MSLVVHSQWCQNNSCLLLCQSSWQVSHCALICQCAAWAGPRMHAVYCSVLLWSVSTNTTTLAVSSETRSQWLLTGPLPSLILTLKDCVSLLQCMSLSIYPDLKIRDVLSWSLYVVWHCVQYLLMRHPYLIIYHKLVLWTDFWSDYIFWLNCQIFVYSHVLKGAFVLKLCTVLPWQRVK